MQKTITLLFSILFFGVPLVFFPKTSELFEFNKIVLLYGVTLFIILAWTLENIKARKIVFKKTLLDWPLLIFIFSQVLSALFSIDQRTSVFGYYSRFNGGLLSVFCYAILYWAFVTHVEKTDLKRLLLNFFLATTITAIWGALEHFGKSPSCFLIVGNFDASCWVQDVSLRVFATFGQPNWMAAWMSAVIPLTWVVLFLKNKKSFRINLLFTFLCVLFTSSLLFTKSKSGILGFIASLALFLVLWLYNNREILAKFFSKKIFLAFLIVLLPFIVFGSPWTPSIFELSKPTEITNKELIPSGTSLETGGTDSGEIRKIVWTGAIDTWRQFPMFGSGVETFAFSYYRGRPVSHNLVSEWNFLYNKAHNEYLNYLATTGIVGFGAYMLLVLISVKQMFSVLREKAKSPEFIFVTAIFCGYFSILVTNFFGFSVVPTSMLFFLAPAVSFVFTKEKEKENKPHKLEIFHRVLVIFSVVVFSYTFLSLVNYWRSDYLYAQAKSAEQSLDYSEAIDKYLEANSLSPNESLYHSSLGSLYADLSASEGIDENLVKSFEDASVLELNKAADLSPQNVKVLKSIANSYATLGDRDSQYILKALEITEIIGSMAPTDPSVLYQRCLAYAKIGKLTEALNSCEQAITLKSDYKIARRLAAFLYEETKEYKKARLHLEYILKYISPEDLDVQKNLNKLAF